MESEQGIVNIGVERSELLYFATVYYSDFSTPRRILAKQEIPHFTGDDIKQLAHDIYCWLWVSSNYVLAGMTRTKPHLAQVIVDADGRRLVLNPASVDELCQLHEEIERLNAGK